LRHSFSVKYLEDGGDLFTLKNILGHKEIRTTSIYLHLTTTLLSRVKTPLEKAA
jgi:integrase/recombinase XerD